MTHNEQIVMKALAAAAKVCEETGTIPGRTKPYWVSEKCAKAIRAIDPESVLK